MKARAGLSCEWPLWSHRIASGTPASIAVEIPPRRAQTPEKPDASTPTTRRAAVIMEENDEDDGQWCSA